MTTLPYDGSVTKVVSESIASPIPKIQPPIKSDSENPPVIAGAEALTANKIGVKVPPFPLNHARILYKNELAISSVVTSTGTGGNKAVIPNTWQRWEFSTQESAEIEFNMPVNEQVDTVCIGSHNLADIGATIDFYYDADPSPGGYILLGSITPDNNHAIMLHIDSEVGANKIKLVINGSGSGYIGYVSAGVSLQMQRPFFSGHTPITDGDSTTYYHNETESGNIIGQQIRSQGYQTSYEWKNLEDDWYRSYFSPFKQAAKLSPFFIAWNLLEYPNDIGFGRIASDISAPFQGVRKYRSLSFEVLGV